METTNADRARNALMNLLDIAEHQGRSMLRLAESLPEAFLTASIARDVIADRCEDTAKLIAEKL